MERPRFRVRVRSQALDGPLAPITIERAVEAYEVRDDKSPASRTFWLTRHEDTVLYLEIPVAGARAVIEDFAVSHDWHSGWCVGSIASGGLRLASAWQLLGRTRSLGLTRGSRTEEGLVFSWHSWLPALPGATHSEALAVDFGSALEPCRVTGALHRDNAPTRAALWELEDDGTWRVSDLNNEVQNGSEWDLLCGCGFGSTGLIQAVARPIQPKVPLQEVSVWVEQIGT